MPSRRASPATLHFVIPLLLVVLAPVPSAQPVERRSAAQVAVAEQKCRAASAALARKAATEVDAMWVFAGCPDSGAAFLAARWRRPLDDSSVVNALVFNSRRMHDARVSEAALAALQNRGNRLATRIAALEVIVAHIDPDLWVEFGPVGTTVFTPLSGGASEVRSEDRVQLSLGRPPMMLTRGKIPITEATRQRLKQALRVLGQGPDDRYLLLAVASLPSLTDSKN